MAKLFYGSICIDTIMEQGKAKHSAFQKGKNGKIYANISVWLNDEPDEYDNVMSLKLSASKEALEKDKEQGKIYIGNCKESDNTTTPINTKDSEKFGAWKDDLPF